jgi:GR25 family glycosyltransferase involved in LPS biosynthesis
MKILVTAIKSRKEYVDEMSKQIPQLEIIWDKYNDCMETFNRAWTSFGEESRIIFQDDILLTENFMDKAIKVINQHSDKVITFFSLKKDDDKSGSRLMDGRTYCMNQCYYLPEGYGKAIHEYGKTWKRKAEHPTADDYLMADFLTDHKLKYLISVPSLVQHREVVSVIDSRRSKKRQSKTFI